MPLIKNLKYTIDEFTLSIPSWSFPDQGITALVGPSGSGKTTLLKVLCGLLPCPSLVWEFQGKDLAQCPPSERNLGVFFQDLRLFPHLSAQDNILIAAQAKGYKREAIQEDFEELVTTLRLENQLPLSVHHLSGGEKQRVALARALMSYPQFLLLDEPFVHLDEENKKEARFLTKRVIEKRSLGALLVSHDRQDVGELAQEVFTLKKGALKS